MVWKLASNVFSEIFWLFYFLILIDSIFETRKNVFLFHFKSSFRSGDIKIFRVVGY